jgi:hypothetical protein
MVKFAIMSHAFGKNLAPKFPALREKKNVYVRYVKTSHRYGIKIDISIFLRENVPYPWEATVTRAKMGTTIF